MTAANNRMEAAISALPFHPSIRHSITTGRKYRRIEARAAWAHAFHTGLACLERSPASGARSAAADSAAACRNEGRRSSALTIFCVVFMIRPLTLCLTPDQLQD